MEHSMHFIKAVLEEKRPIFLVLTNKKTSGGWLTARAFSVYKSGLPVCIDSDMRRLLDNAEITFEMDDGGSLPVACYPLSHMSVYDNVYTPIRRAFDKANLPRTDFGLIYMDERDGDV